MIFDMSDETHVGDGTGSADVRKDGISYQVFGTTFSGGCTNQSRLNFFGVVQVIVLKVQDTFYYVGLESLEHGRFFPFSLDSLDFRLIISSHHLGYLSLLRQSSGLFDYHSLIRYRMPS